MSSSATVFYNKEMKFRYMIVEDAAFVRELIKGVCESAGGVCVGESEGGNSSLDLIRQTLPDLIFLDLVLPGQNGISLAKEIRKAWPEARLIACTSLEVQIIEKASLEAGIDSIVSKPFTAEFLKQTIQEQLYRRKEVAT